MRRIFEDFGRILGGFGRHFGRILVRNLVRILGRNFGKDFGGRSTGIAEAALASFEAW